MTSPPERVRTRQSRDYGANRLVIHTLHHRPLRRAARARWSALLEVGGVDLGEARPLVGQLVLGEAGVHRAGLDARVAVDALVRIDEELLTVS